MALFTRRSILDKSILVRSFHRFRIVAFCAIPVVSTAPQALAQRPAGGVHMSAAPVHSTSTHSSPIFRAPTITPRISAIRSTDVLGTASFLPPRRPIRHFPPVLLVYESPFAFGGPFSGFNCWSANCDLLWPLMFDYVTVSFPSPANYLSQSYEAPGFDYGEEGADMPQLYLKDGSILNVTDYWLIDDQLHFTMIQEYGAKPEEEQIPFEALDLQKTVDINTRRGFHFMLRNEPFEQYVRDHP
jgi:hypothetical protein